MVSPSAAQIVRGVHRMGRLRCVVPIVLFAAALASSACGGGGSAFDQPPPPPSPDFGISFSSGSITLAQGATSAPLILAVSPMHGFQGDVQVTLSGLPSGVTSTPAGALTISAGSSASLTLSAASTAVTGNFSLIAQATGGGDSHSASINGTVQAGAPPAASRTSFIRTDSIAALDDPP